MKSIFLKIFSLIAVTGFTSLSNAYSVNSFQQQLQPINFSKNTHIFVIGGEDQDQGSQFLMTATSKVRQYLNYFPDRQYLILTVNADKKFKEINQNFLQKNGFLLVEDLSFNLDTTHLIEFINRFQDKKIESLELIWHGNPLLGQALQGQTAVERYFNGFHPRIKELKAKLSENAYMLLIGCNSGWTAAPNLSKVLDIPVAGSLTGTQFYQRNKENNTYTNSNAKISTEPCKTGPCTRMLPQPSSYLGWAGDLRERGLGFYKFFCNFENPSPMQYSKCLKAMAYSLKGFPSLYQKNAFKNESAFRPLVADFICGSLAKNKYESCHKKLSSADVKNPLQYSPFSGETLKCDFNGCFAKVTCADDETKQYFFKPGSCTFEKAKTLEKSQQTYWNEYVAYLYGFSLLKSKLEN